MGKKNKVICKETIMTSPWFNIAISPTSFWVNPVQTEKLYKLAIEQVGLMVRKRY